ncbi:MULTISPECIES: hypothetical protein [unclassified Streptomyces]
MRRGSVTAATAAGAVMEIAGPDPVGILFSTTAPAPATAGRP